MLFPKKYFRDRTILVLLSASLFLILVTVLDIILKLTQTTGDFIVQCRNCQEYIPTFSRGSLLDILNFILFAVMIFAVSVVMSARTYRIHRQLSVVVVFLGLVLLLFNLRVVDALLGQR